MHEYVFKMKKGEIEIELKSDDLEIIRKRFGNNYDENFLNSLNREEKAKFYSIISVMKRKLNKQKQEGNTSVINEKKTDVILEDSSKKEIIEEQPSRVINETTKESDIKKTSSTIDSLLEIFKKPEFVDLLKETDPLEYVILALKLGYATGESYSTSAIAEFLKIDQSQVIESAKKGLKSYKEKIIKSIDSIAETDTIKIYQKKK